MVAELFSWRLASFGKELNIQPSTSHLGHLVLCLSGRPSKLASLDLFLSRLGSGLDTLAFGESEIPGPTA